MRVKFGLRRSLCRPIHFGDSESLPILEGKGTHRPTMDRGVMRLRWIWSEPWIGVDPPNYAELSDLRMRGMIIFS
jgi:hypothetical protein